MDSEGFEYRKDARGELVHPDPFKDRRSRSLTEAEVKAVVSAKDAQICEWALGNVTFVYSASQCGIVKTNAMGGDVYDVLEGWKYPHNIASGIEWAEICALPENVYVAPEWASRIKFR